MKMEEIASTRQSLKRENGTNFEVRYAIVAEKETAGRFECEHYGVKVETEFGEQALFRDVTTSRSRIEELYSLLHRNGVTPITTYDVLEDWL